jgi:hypothetical protein
MKCLQAMTTVSLLRLPILSFILWTKGSELFWGCLITSNSMTPHTKQSNGLQPDELCSQTFAEHRVSCNFRGFQLAPVCTVRRKVCWIWSLYSSPVAEWLALLTPLFTFRRHQMLKNIWFGKWKIQRRCLDPLPAVWKESKNSWRTLYSNLTLTMLSIHCFRQLVWFSRNWFFW